MMLSGLLAGIKLTKRAGGYIACLKKRNYIIGVILPASYKVFRLIES